MIEFKCRIVCDGDDCDASITKHQVGGVCADPHRDAMAAASDAGWLIRTPSVSVQKHYCPKCRL